jgi:hypothetical protein
MTVNELLAKAWESGLKFWNDPATKRVMMQGSEDNPQHVAWADRLFSEMERILPALGYSPEDPPETYGWLESEGELLVRIMAGLTYMHEYRPPRGDQAWLTLAALVATYDLRFGRIPEDLETRIEKLHAGVQP